MSLLNSRHQVSVHDWNPNRLVGKSGWALKRGGEHVVLTSRELFALLQSHKAVLEIDRKTWHKLTHPHIEQHRRETFLSLRKEAGDQAARASSLQADARSLRAKANNAKNLQEASKLHREAAAKEQQLAVLLAKMGVTKQKLKHFSN